MKTLLEKMNEMVGDGNINESDDDNPIYMFQGMSTKLLIKIASGKINAQEYAKHQMAQRGFGKKGEWVGFDQAEKIWKPKVK